MRSVTMLWQNVEQFVVSKEMATTGNIVDFTALKGKSVGLGKQNSGTLGANRILLSGLELDIEKDFTLMHAGYGPTADALANGQVVGFNISSGPPTSAITKLMAANKGKFTILDITDEQAAKMDGGRSLWTKYVIKADTYPGQDKDVTTIAQPNFLAVNASVDEEHVYQLTKTIYENLAFLQAIHNVTKSMNTSVAIAGLPVPLHPGAARYYKEIGLTIPERLMPK
jgi:TRAP transporter TAXI family solute receptor